MVGATVGSRSANLGAGFTSIMAGGSHPQQAELETVKSCPGKPQNASTSFCHSWVRLHGKSEHVIKEFSCGWEEVTRQQDTRVQSKSITSSHFRTPPDGAWGERGRLSKKRQTPLHFVGVQTYWRCLASHFTVNTNKSFHAGAALIISLPQNTTLFTFLRYR